MDEGTAGQEVADPLLEGDRPVSVKRVRFYLFLVGFLVLFLELACIRWFATYVVFLQFFTNVVLIACFLGMSVGCLAAKSKTDWLARFPRLAFWTMGLAAALSLLAQYWSGLRIDVGGQESPQLVFFGTEYHSVDLTRFVLPMELLAGVFFVLIALMFVGLGQVLGRCFDADPERVRAYTANVLGSLAGIAVFSLASFLGAPPLVWFAIGFGGVAYLLKKSGKLDVLTLSLTLVMVTALAYDWRPGHQLSWSPYYAISYDRQTRDIAVNRIGHQAMSAFEEKGAIYSLIYLLNEHSGGRKIKDVLIIGAGSGNDLAHSLRHGVEQVDAVEIDPVIQALGAEFHPDRPYADERVRIHLDDGRHFLRQAATAKYDLIIYALVDSLILHSSYSNIRLESYLFTEQAFADVQRALKPDGTFVMYNYYRQGWIVERLARMVTKEFGAEPVTIALPYQEAISGGASTSGGFTVIIAGGNEPIKNAFARHDQFWLHENPSANGKVNGFTFEPGNDAAAKYWHRIKPAMVVAGDVELRAATDDWPFLYLRAPTIPSFMVRAMLLLGLLGLGMVWYFAPNHQLSVDRSMFFLGAAFLLLETKTVVHMALLFGSTWLTNSIVFFVILTLILAANLLARRLPTPRLGLFYVGLFVSLALNFMIPLDTFLSGGVAWRYLTPTLLSLSPIFFAGVIFAMRFRVSAHPDRDFGSNIAGAVVGGLAEYFSMLLGFQYLLVVVVALYFLSVAPLPGERGASAP